MPEHLECTTIKVLYKCSYLCLYLLLLLLFSTGLCMHSSVALACVCVALACVCVKERIVLCEIYLRTTGCHLSNGITQCLSATRQRWRPCLHPNRAGWYSIYRPREDERLSCSSWLVTYRNGLPVHRRSPIRILQNPNCLARFGVIQNLFVLSRTFQCLIEAICLCMKLQELG